MKAVDQRVSETGANIYVHSMIIEHSFMPSPNNWLITPANFYDYRYRLDLLKSIIQLAKEKSPYLDSLLVGVYIEATEQTDTTDLS